MILEFRGIEAFVAGIDKAVAAYRREVTEVYRGLCVKAFYEVVNNTPQWSGSAVANWNFSATGMVDSSVDMSFKESATTAAERTSVGSQKNRARHIFGTAVASKGDPRAVTVAIQRNSGRDSQVTLGVPVFISNAAQSIDRKSYIMYLEQNPNNFLRPENEPGHMVENAVNKLAGFLNSVDVGLLRALTLSGGFS